MRALRPTLAGTIFLCLSACGGSNTVNPGSLAAPAAANYQLSVFAKAPSPLKPDDMVVHGGSVYVVAQDANDNPDGTIVPGTTPQSKVLQYDTQGNLVQSFNVPGHPDGIMEFDSGTLWITTNEDANAELIILNTVTNSMSIRLPDAAPIHGGGLDDLKLLGGNVYVAASNPNLGPATPAAPNGVSTVPALYQMTLNADNKTFHLTTVLMGNATATNLVTQAAVTLNLTDPDSMAIDSSGDLVLDSQQDSELVFIKNPGAGQTVSVLPVALNGGQWPLDDTRWAQPGGFLLVSDTHSRNIYRVDAPSGFRLGSAYSAGATDLLSLDASTGVLTPLFEGLGSPHGIIFVVP